MSVDRPWLVVPCFNEAARLNPSAFQEAMSDHHGPSFLFVNDGSTDKTLNVLKDLCRQHSARCEVLQLKYNVGKAEAVRTGLLHTISKNPDFVGYWDADLATPLSALRDLTLELEKDSSIDVAMGSRVRMLGRAVRRSNSRHYIGRAFATSASLILRLPVYDTQCGAKLFRRTPELERALRNPFHSRWAFDVELLFRLQLLWGDNGEARIVEVPLARWEDVRGSKVSIAAGVLALCTIMTLPFRSSQL